MLQVADWVCGYHEYMPTRAFHKLTYKSADKITIICSIKIYLRAPGPSTSSRRSSVQQILHLMPSHIYVYADAERAEHPPRRRYRRQLRSQRRLLTSGQSLPRPPVPSLATFPLYVHRCPASPHPLPLRLRGHAGGAGGCNEAEMPNREPVPRCTISWPPRWPGGPCALPTGKREEVPLHERGNAHIMCSSCTTNSNLILNIFSHRVDDRVPRAVFQALNEISEREVAPAYPEDEMSGGSLLR